MATKGTQTDTKAEAKAPAKKTTRKSLDKMVDANKTTAASGYQAYYRQCLKAGKVLK